MKKTYINFGKGWEKVYAIRKDGIWYYNTGFNGDVNNMETKSLNDIKTTSNNTKVKK
jgi:hypothetical protein